MQEHLWKYHIYAPVMYPLECAHVETFDTAFTASSVKWIFTRYQDTDNKFSIHQNYIRSDLIITIRAAVPMALSRASVITRR